MIINLQEKILNALLHGLRKDKIFNHMPVMIMIIMIAVMVLFVAVIACVTICKWLNDMIHRWLLCDTTANQFSKMYYNLFKLIEFNHAGGSFFSYNFYGYSMGGQKPTKIERDYELMIGFM